MDALTPQTNVTDAPVAIQATEEKTLRSGPDQSRTALTGIESPSGPQTADLAMLRLAFAQHILDKRFHLELWLDGRVNSSLTLNAILGSISVFLIDHASETAPFVRVLMFLGISFFMLDLLLCSYLKIPRFIARKQHGQEAHYLTGNVRTTIDIEAYAAEDYRAKFKSITPSEMIMHTADQIKHVNSLIVQERRFINVSAYLTMCGITCMAASILILIASSSSFSILPSVLSLLHIHHK